MSLPTRDVKLQSWATFNVGAPHYFLREEGPTRAQYRDWMLARITKVEEHVVKVEDDEDSPLDLSNGLRWFMSRASPLQVGQGTVSNVNPTTYNLNRGL